MIGLINKLVNSFDAEERDAIAKEAFTYAFEQYSTCRSRPSAPRSPSTPR
jgi:hypothetical protein